MAKEQGITNEEMGAVESIVMAVSAGRVNAQFREARNRMRAQEEDGSHPDSRRSAE